MFHLGESQELYVVKEVGFGIYLGEEENATEKVLLPKKEVPEGIKAGDILEVFLYKDSQDRLIATTRTPKVRLGETAVLRVADTGKIGAFLDWGLEKDLFLPYKEQTKRVQPGEECLAALYIDKSSRLCATMKVYEYLKKDSPYQRDDKVTGRIYEISENFGVFVAVDDCYSGLIPAKEAQGKYRVGDILNLRVTRVQEDGKLDLSDKEKIPQQMEKDAGYHLEDAEWVKERLQKEIRTCGEELKKAEETLVQREKLVKAEEQKKAEQLQVEQLLHEQEKKMAEAQAQKSSAREILCQILGKMEKDEKRKSDSLKDSEVQELTVSAMKRLKSCTGEISEKKSAVEQEIQRREELKKEEGRLRAIVEQEKEKTVQLQAEKKSVEERIKEEQEKNGAESEREEILKEQILQKQEEQKKLKALQQKNQQEYEQILQKKAENEATIQTIRVQLEQLEDVNEEEILKEKSRMTEEKSQMAEEKKELYVRYSGNREIYDKVNVQRDLLEEVEKKYVWMKSLADTAGGNLNGKQKVELETYIQMAYFDRILRRANLRFMTMSSGQYELKRQKAPEDKKGKSGLELNVIDHYNGSERSVKTLSGGESFQASLSLALGLSDEIQANAGGICLEAMFVDEGFGSLDEEALEQAIKALGNLTQGNRSVGIISHVAELKERIENKIIVTKERGGEKLGSRIEII